MASGSAAHAVGRQEMAQFVPKIKLIEQLQQISANRETGLLTIFTEDNRSVYLRFSNGEPFTADAVVNVVDYLNSERGATESIARELYPIASARAIDDLEVEITTQIVVS